MGIQCLVPTFRDLQHGRRPFYQYANVARHAFPSGDIWECTTHQCRWANRGYVSGVCYTSVHTPFAFASTLMIDDMRTMLTNVTATRELWHLLYSRSHHSLDLFVDLLSEGSLLRSTASDGCSGSNSSLQRKPRPLPSSKGFILCPSSDSGRIMLVLSAIFVGETYAPTLLRRKAVRLQQMADEQGTAEVFISKYDENRKSRIEIIKIGLSRPFDMMFKEVIVAALGTYGALIYGILYVSLHHTSIRGVWMILWLTRISCFSLLSQSFSNRVVVGHVSHSFAHVWAPDIRY